MKRSFQVGEKIKFVDGMYSQPTKACVRCVSDNGNIAVYINYDTESGIYIIHPRQVTHRIVKRKKVYLTREALAKAWDSEEFKSANGNHYGSKISIVFNVLCRELGL
jgi:hypothetical protein